MTKLDAKPRQDGNAPKPCFWVPGEGITIGGVLWRTQKQCRHDLGLSERELKRVRETGILPVHARAAFRRHKEAADEAAEAARKKDRRDMRRGNCPVAQAGMNTLFACRAMAWKVREAIRAYELDPEACAEEVEAARNALETAQRVRASAHAILARLHLDRRHLDTVRDTVKRVDAILFRCSVLLGMQGDADENRGAAEAWGRLDEGWPPGMELHYLLEMALPEVILVEAQAEHASNLAVIAMNARLRRHADAQDLLEEMVTCIVPEGDDGWTEEISRPALKWIKRPVDHPGDEL